MRIISLYPIVTVAGGSRAHANITHSHPIVPGVRRLDNIDARQLQPSQNCEAGLPNLVNSLSTHSIEAASSHYAAYVLDNNCGLDQTQASSVYLLLLNQFQETSVVDTIANYQTQLSDPAFVSAMANALEGQSFADLAQSFTSPSPAPAAATTTAAVASSSSAAAPAATTPTAPATTTAAVASSSSAAAPAATTPAAPATTTAAVASSSSAAAPATTTAAVASSSSAAAPAATTPAATTPTATTPTATTPTATTGTSLAPSPAPAAPATTTAEAASSSAEPDTPTTSKFEDLLSTSLPMLVSSNEATALSSLLSTTRVAQVELTTIPAEEPTIIQLSSNNNNSAGSTLTMALASGLGVASICGCIVIIGAVMYINRQSGGDRRIATDDPVESELSGDRRIATDDPVESELNGDGEVRPPLPPPSTPQLDELPDNDELRILEPRTMNSEIV